MSLSASPDAVRAAAEAEEDALLVGAPRKQDVPARAGAVISIEQYQQQRQQREALAASAAANSAPEAAAFADLDDFPPPGTPLRVWLVQRAARQQQQQ